MLMSKKVSCYTNSYFKKIYYWQKDVTLFNSIVIVTVQVATKTQSINMNFTPLSEKEELIARKRVD